MQPRSFSFSKESEAAAIRPTVSWAETVLGESQDSKTVSGGEEEYVRRHISRYVNTIRLLPPGPGRLLDVGCFPGHLSLLAAARGWEVSGVSRMEGPFIGPSFKDRMRKHGISISSADVERETFPFDDDYFDAVFFNETVEHLPFNPYHAFDQIWRVLKPGGTLIFSVPNLASFDHRWALLKGRTIYPLLTKSLGETFHSDISQRHIREYTPQECRYLMSDQNKYLYTFKIKKLIMDRSWDGLFYTEHGYEPRLGNIRIGTVLRTLITRLFPGTRSNIVIVATKPASYLKTPQISFKSEGFYPAEPAGAGDSFVRQPLEACWTGAEACITIERSNIDRPIRKFEFLGWLPSPPSLGPVRVQVRVNEAAVDDLVFTPSSEPARISIAMPWHVGESMTDKTVTIQFTTSGWKPSEHGISADTRTLGVMICLQQLAVVCADGSLRARRD